jgi:cystathionine beta-lyase/cystathionine gamma-synthase
MTLAAPSGKSHRSSALVVDVCIGGCVTLLSIQVVGGERAAMKGAAHVELYKRATSLGGVESLIEHRASIEGAGAPSYRLAVLLNLDRGYRGSRRVTL